MTVSSVAGIFQNFAAGKQLIDGSDLMQLVNALFGVKTGIVAKAGGGQAGATQLTGAINRVDTVVTNSDSVMLPLAIPGAAVKVYNNSANLLAIFGSPSNPNNANAGDTIAASGSNAQQPTATGITLATTLIAEFDCFVLGQWKQFLTA